MTLFEELADTNHSKPRPYFRQHFGDAYLLEVQKNFPKTLPKLFQNPPEILFKLSRKPPKTLPNPSGGLPPNRARPKINVFSFFLRCCCILFNFWMIFGLPKSSQNHQKFKNNAEKSMLKKHMCFNTFFFRLVLVLASENDSQIEVFSLFFRKRRFCET